MRIGSSFAVLVALFATCAAQYNDRTVYGMQGLEFTPQTQRQLDEFRDYEMSNQADFQNLPSIPGGSMIAYITSDQLDHFKAMLTKNGISFQVLVEDMGALLEEHMTHQWATEMLRSGFGPELSFTYYPRYNEIEKYFKMLSQNYSDIVKTFSLGKSFEGRDILGIKFSTGGDKKPALLIDGGVHAREWLAPSTALYLIKEFAESPENRKYFENIDIYIIPMLNPDGYEYTHENITSRMWRKTRSKQPNSECLGVDANRNFDFYWNTTGSSSDPCSNLYAGPRAFSEPETRALRDFILARRDRIKAYVTLHSFGSYLLYPWGYAKVHAKNEELLSCVAKAAARELKKVRGTEYKIGSSGILLYPAAGGSDDWAMGVAGVDAAYTMELPGNKSYGFVAPPSEIIPVGQETFEAMKVFAQYVDRLVCLWP